MDTDVASLSFKRRELRPPIVEALVGNQPCITFVTLAAVRRGRPSPQNDMWIAACCLSYGVAPATLNTKYFADFAEHEGLLLVGR